MPKKRTYPINQFPCHISARTYDREWFDLPMIQVWDIFSRLLLFSTLTYEIRIHAFVLMSNHFHMLATAPRENLEKAIANLLRDAGEIMAFEAGEKDSVFCEPHHTTPIKNRLYYRQAYKYVYRNPVEARICKRVEAYPYSSLRGLLGMDPLRFPAFDNLDLIVNPQAQLSWLNSPYPDVSYLEDIEIALKNPVFELKDQLGFPLS